MTAHMPAAGKNIWVEVAVDSTGEEYTVIVVEPAAVAQQVEFTAAELARILNEKGSAALHGILFDTGQATIKDESKGDLQAIDDRLKQQAALRPGIHRNIDNVAGERGSGDRGSEIGGRGSGTGYGYRVSGIGVTPSKLSRDNHSRPDERGQHE